MPELPEVEAYARYFAKHALRRKIARIDVRDERILGTRRDRMARALRGESFRRVHRHGKHLFVGAAKSWLHLHFGMSGDLAFYQGEGEAPRFARVVFDFADGTHLAFEDMRLFGVVELVPSPEEYVEAHRLGPDPLSTLFSLARFRERLEGKRGSLKSLLMSQESIAGVGNLYADETLFQSRLSPLRPLDSLSAAEGRAMYSALRRILREAVARRTTGRQLPGRWLAMNRDTDQPCPLCGGSLQRTVVVGRTTYYCASHQR